MTAEYYYVTQRPDQMDFYMLHRAGCPAMPAKETLLFIGSLYDVSQALTVAQMRAGKKVKACYHCCRPRQEGEPPLPDKIQSRRHSNN